MNELLEPETLKVFNEMLVDVSLYSKNRMYFRSDWIESSYTVSTSPEHRQRIFARVEFTRTHVIINRTSEKQNVGHTIEYINPRCTSKEIARLLDKFLEY